MPATQLVTIGQANVNRLIHANVPVTTFEMVAEVHGISVKTVRSAYQYNRKRFVEGIHKFRLDFATAKSLLVENQVANSQGLIVLTKKGYLLLVKALTDDVSWEVQTQMVDEYFAMLESTPAHHPVLAPHRLSRTSEHIVTMEDGNQFTVRIKLPSIAWDICDEIFGYRISGPMMHELIYPWIEDAAKAEYRERKKTGVAGGRKGDTFGQHLTIDIFYGGTIEMVGMMKAALAQIRRREEMAPLSNETKIAMFKELTMATVRSVGVVIPLLNGKAVALYPDNRQELFDRLQLPLFQNT